MSSKVTQKNRSTLKLALPALAASCVLAMGGTAFAQGESKDCPPGSWFCGETAPPPAGANGDLKPLPSDAPTAKAPPPPVVVYQPPPTTVVVQPREAPPAYYYVPRRPIPRREWGLNLHVGGLLIGSGRTNDAGMAVAGLGLRYRPVPAFALEADVDFAGGTDYNGFSRHETGLGFNGLFFLNPRSKTQVYLVAGFGWQGATATDNRYFNSNGTEYHYGYFGGQGGIGLEFRLSKVVALNFDFRGFVRSRIDDHKDEYAEFTDANGRQTNTSGGGIFQGGLTFYW